MLDILFIGVVLFAGFLLISSLYPSLSKRLKVKANSIIEKVSDTIDDPSEEAKYDIKKAEEELLKYKQTAASLLAQNIKLKADNNVNSSDIDKYNRLAESAASRGNEQDVREFLERKSMSQKKFDTLALVISQNESLLNDIRDNVDKHENRIELAKNKASQLESRLTNAELRDKMSSLSLSDSGLGNLDEFEKRVIEAESLSTAKIQMDTDIESKYTSSNVEEELSGLMSRFKKV